MSDETVIALVDELYELAHNTDLDHAQCVGGLEEHHCDFLHVLKILKDRVSSQDDPGLAKRQFGGKTFREYMADDTQTRWDTHQERKVQRAAKVEALVAASKRSAPTR